MAALLGGQNNNAEIAQRARINDVLETMIGQPLHPPHTNALSAYNPPIPDFVNLPAPPSYKDLREIISYLELIDKNLEDNMIKLSGFNKYPDEIEKCNAISRNLSDARLNEMSLVVLMGAHCSAVYSTAVLRFGVSNRLTELRELQRAHYPTGKGRKKNARAYLVAEKLARFYANRCKEKPSYGTGDGRIPSTSYTRALERIYEILGIQATLRGPAESAIAGLTDADLNPTLSRFNALAGVFGPPTA